MSCIAIAAIAWFAAPARIDGHTDRVSYDPAETQTVYLGARRSLGISTIRLFDTRGNVVDSVEVRVPLQSNRSDEAWKDGFGWKPTFSYPLRNLARGVYLWQRSVPFVVRSKSLEPDIVVVYPASTVAAYNTSGGKSLYVPSRWWRIRSTLRHLIRLEWRSVTEEDLYPSRARTVSFRRTNNKEHWSYFAPFLRWISGQNGYDVAYVADPDLDVYERIAGARLLIVIGHSEYWTRKAREDFDRFVDSGKPALVLSGNTMWWQTRYSDDGSALICYWEWDEDPVVNPLQKTVVWTDARLDYPIWRSIGAQFDLGGYGLRDDEGWDGYRIVSPESPLLEGIDLPGDSIISVPMLEYDGTWLRIGARRHPEPDREKLGFERIDLVGYDYGSREGTTTGTFIVFQKSDSSGVVVNTGSMNWCAENSFDGEDSLLVRRITHNAIEKLLDGTEVFSP